MLLYMIAHDVCDFWLYAGKCRLRMVRMSVMLEPAKLTLRLNKNNNLIAVSHEYLDVGEASSAAIRQRLPT